MKKTKQKKQQEKVQQEASKPIATPKLCKCGSSEHEEGHCDGSHKKAVVSELDQKVKSFRAKGRSDQQIANLLMVSYDIIIKIK